MKLYKLDGPWPVYTDFLYGYAPIDSLEEERIKTGYSPKELSPKQAIDYLIRFNVKTKSSKIRIKKQIRIIEEMVKDEFYKEVLE